VALCPRFGKYGLILTLTIVVAGDMFLHVIGTPVNEHTLVITLAPLLMLLAAAAAIGEIGASIIAGALQDRDGA
jgi:hypothetical protein